METVIRATNRVIDTSIRIICIILLLMCAYAGYDTYMVFNKATDNTIQKFKPTESIAEVEEVMPDCIAWITIPDTNIDYPVMQGLTNSDYLNTDPYGNYSFSGSIFLDSRNKADFSDSYSLIYGHHMEYGVMFGSLDDFAKRDFFDAHRTGELIVGDKKYELNFFAAINTNANVEDIFDPKDKETIVTYLQDNADIIYSPGQGNVVGLSTCAGAGSTARFAVFGTIREISP